MLKGDLLESQSWLRCSPTCVGRDVTPNSNLAGATLILYLNLLIFKLFQFASFERNSWFVEFDIIDHRTLIIDVLNYLHSTSITCKMYRKCPCKERSPLSGRNPVAFSNFLHAPSPSLLLPPSPPPLSFRFSPLENKCSKPPPANSGACVRLRFTMGHEQAHVPKLVLSLLKYEFEVELTNNDRWEARGYDVLGTQMYQPVRIWPAENVWIGSIVRALLSQHLCIIVDDGPTCCMKVPFVECR